MEQDDHPAPPLIGVQCCLRPLTPQGLHTVSAKYVEAVSRGAGGLPLLVPATGDARAAAQIVARLDGLLVPGARSNIEPHHYDGAPAPEGSLRDPARDATILPLLRAAVVADLPVLAICRGIQELNVALGGTLHPQLHEVSGRLDHRAPKGKPLAERYAPRAHAVALTPGGLFAALADGAATITVNSLHQQGIDRLAPGLTVEATAPDGQIEGVRVAGASFIVGVQWHPEFRFADNPFSTRLFAAFGAACRARTIRSRLTGV